MVSAISNTAPAEATQAFSTAPAPSSVSSAASAQLAPDTVSISAAGRQAAAADVDHDGDSH
jgi:hypothetical protein